MRLIDLIPLASEWSDEETTIYAASPWSPESEAILMRPSPGTTEPVERDGTNFIYFLETFIAREVLEDYMTTPSGAEATDEAKCERLIRYADNDA